VNAALATVIASALGAIGLIIGAVLSSYLNRHKDDAAVADQVSKAWTPLVSELRTEVAETKRECVDCRKELGQVKRALRTAISAWHSKDPDLIDAAIEAARDLL
jgi:hypothetical protein